VNWVVYRPWDRLTKMSRADYIGILVVALVGFAGVDTVEVLTLLDIQEWIEFVVAAFTFAVILFGIYEFIGGSSGRRGAWER
jgi:hypothetical protein